MCALVTGVQTCALPISLHDRRRSGSRILGLPGSSRRRLLRAGTSLCVERPSPPHPPRSAAAAVGIPPALAVGHYDLGLGCRRPLPLELDLAVAPDLRLVLVRGCRLAFTGR